MEDAEALTMGVDFPSTTWSLVRDAAGGNRDAMGSLFELYGPPVRNYLRQRGSQEADDLSQEIFTRVCTAEFLSKADPAAGKFRTLLLRVTQHVFVDDLRHRHAKRRGGGAKEISIEQLQEAYSTVNVPIPADEPRDEEFDRLWAGNLLRLALQRLREANADQFEMILAHVQQKKTYEEIAAERGKKLHDVRNAIHLGKKRLRAIVGELVEGYTPEVPAELEALKAHLTFG